MTKPLAAITRRPPGSAVNRVEDEADVWLWAEDRPIPVHELREAVASADGLYCMLTDTIDADLLDAAPRLRVVSNMAVGVDNIDLEACTARGVPVGHTPDVLNETTADTAFALLLAASRRLGEGRDYVRAGNWNRWEPELLLGHDVHGSTLGIIGLGRVGEAIARRAAGFAMRVLYFSRHRRPEAEAGLGVLYRGLGELLAESDHVIVATPLTPETRHIVDAAALSKMKPTATLVNISRGGTVDSDALVHALESGEIAAAGLDVTDPEPIPNAHPLVGLENCFIIPHLGSSSRRTREAMAMLAADNLLAGLRGARLPACANPGVYGKLGPEGNSQA
ncbi:MAG: D-glycerate dehydrogenase [Acidimicrobiia bacterium]|nr:D-glycerate dehydrogenase [Acidimicrobiia bacterium]